MGDMVYSKKDEGANDMWDDTELIKMYEDAIKAECNPSVSSDSDSSNKKWKVGDRCGAPYYEDDLYYPAKIISIDYHAGEAEILFESYENTEVVAISDLCTSTDLEDAQQDADEIAQSPVKQEAVTQEVARPSAKKDRRRNRNNSPRASTSRSNDRSSVPNIPMLPPFAPPPPPEFSSRVNVPDEMEALSSMMMSWYMSGYHTGYYQCLQDMKKKEEEKS